MLVTVSECGAGVNKDLLPSELAAGMWSDSLNIRFRNGFAEKRKGFQSAYTTPTKTPYAIATFSTATARYLVQACTDAVFVDDGSTRTDITGAVTLTGARDDRWTISDFNGVLVLNNSVDDPQYWNGNPASTLATISGWSAGDSADAIRPFKNYLVALAPTISGTKYPYRVKWSNAAEPGALPTSWTAAVTNDAGEIDVIGIGQLVDAVQFGDVLVLYGQQGRCAMRYVGGNDVFSFQNLPGRDGLLTRQCAVQVPSGHVFLTNGDVRIHAGGESQSIADGVIRKWLSATMDSTNATRSFVCTNPQESEVWVVFPSANQNDCDTVAAWNWKDNTWGIFSAPNLTCGISGLVSSALSAITWSSQTLTWDTVTNVWSQNEAASNEARLIVATSTPQIGLANTGSLDFGTRISWCLEKTGIGFGDSDRLKVISRSRPHLNAASGTQVTVKHAATMNPNDSPIYEGSATYTQGASNWADLFANAGRYAAIRLEGMDDQPVSIRSYDFELTQSRARF